MIEALAEVITALFKALGEIFSLLLSLFSKDHSLKAKFVSERTILKRKNRGFRITGRKALSKIISYRNALISGVTGRGKSTIAIVPTILSLDSSQLIHDPSGELFQLTAGALQEQGYEIIQVDFSKATGHFFNPFLRANSRAEINQLISQLAKGDKKQKGDKFFDQKGIECASVFTQILKTQPQQFHNGCNLAYLLDLFQAKDPKIDELFAIYASDALHAKYLSLLGTPDKTLGSIVASAQAFLQIFSMDECIAYVTSKDNINLNLRSQKTALFIHSSIAKLHYYSGITSIFIEQLFAEVFKQLPQEDEQDIFFILDEAPVLKLNLDAYCSNIRKYRGGILIITQDAKSQLRAQYGAERAQTIISNCYTRMYMGAEMESALELEKILGQYEYSDKENKKVKHKRSLLSVDEIMALDERFALILTSGKQAVKARLKPFYKIYKLKKLTEVTYENKLGISIIGDVPLIPLPDENTIPEATEPIPKTTESTRKNFNNPLNE